MRKEYQSRRFAVLVASMLAAGGIQAAELKSLEWKESFGEEALLVGVDGKVEVETRELDEGKRIRISFPASSVANDMAPVAGKGIITAITPVTEGKDVYLDLTTSVPAHASGVHDRPHRETGCSRKWGGASGSGGLAFHYD